MAQLGQNRAAERAAGAGAGPGLATEQGPARGRVIFLNALPLNSLPRRHMQVDILPVSLQELAQWINRRLQEGYIVEHYIRHAATIAMLRSLGIPLNEQPNSGLYSYDAGDIIVVVSLRSPVRGQEQQHVNISDLEAWVVTVL